MEEVALIKKNKRIQRGQQKIQVQNKSLRNNPTEPKDTSLAKETSIP